MNGYNAIPLNRAGGESYDQGRQMTMEEAQRIAQQYGHVAQRISSGAADPNTGYMGVYGVPTEQGFIPVDQLQGRGPQQGPSQQLRPPMAGQSGPIADTINRWQSQGVPNSSPPPPSMTPQTSPRMGAIASYAAQQPQQQPRQGAIASYAQQQPQQPVKQFIWPAPPGLESNMSDRLRGPYRAPNDPSLQIQGATIPNLQNPPPSMMQSAPLQPQSKHYQFDPNFYGPQQEQQSGWEQWMPWNWGK